MLTPEQSLSQMTQRHVSRAPLFLITLLVVAIGDQRPQPVRQVVAPLLVFWGSISGSAQGKIVREAGRGSFVSVSEESLIRRDLLPGNLMSSKPTISN